MTTQKDDKPTAADFAVPISTARRLMDFATLGVGILIIVHSIRAGAAALLILPLGIAVSGAALWLLTRKTRRLSPPKLARRYGAALAERIGHSASTPEARYRYIHEYLKGVRELDRLAKEVWEVASRGMHPDYEAIVRFNTPDSEVSVTASSESDDNLQVSVSGLTAKERAKVEQIFGINSTETSEVVHLGTLSGEQTTQATERVFRVVLNRKPEYVLTAWLRCILPPGLYHPWTSMGDRSRTDQKG